MKAPSSTTRRPDRPDRDDAAVEAMLLVARPELVPLPESRPETPSDLSSSWYTEPNELPPPAKGEELAADDGDLRPAAADEPDAAAEDDDEAKTCRICFGGEFDDPELGRLISPCVCKGTARYVHVACLAQWRQMSASKKAFWKCDQCAYSYRFARTRVAGLATNKVALAVTSVLLFLALTLGTGQLMHLALDWAQGTVFESLLQPAPSLYASTTAFDLVRESVAVLSSGEAEELLGRVVRGVTALVHPAPAAPPSAWSTLNPFSHALDWLQAAAAGPPPPLPAPAAPALLLALKDRFLLGLGAVGAAGALLSVVGSSAMPLVSMLNTLRLPIPFVSGVGRRRAGAVREGPGVGAVLVVSLVFYGGVQVVKSLYRTQRRTTEWVLRRAESAVLDVGATADDGGAPAQAEHPAEGRWRARARQWAALVW